MSITLPANRLSQLQNSALDLLEQVLNTAAAQVQAATDSPDPALLREARLAAESAIKLVSTTDRLDPPPSPLAPPAVAATESASTNLQADDLDLFKHRAQSLAPSASPDSPTLHTPALLYYHETPARALLAAAGAPHPAHPP